MRCPGVWIGGKLLYTRRKLPRHQVSKGHRLKYRAQVGTDGNPDLLEVVGTAAVADRLRRLGLDVGDRSLNRTDHVGDRDLIGGRVSQ